MVTINNKKIKKKRTFKVGINNKIKINDYGSIKINNLQKIHFLDTIKQSILFEKNQWGLKIILKKRNYKFMGANANKIHLIYKYSGSENKIKFNKYLRDEKLKFFEIGSILE